MRLFCAEFDDPRWLAIEQMPDADAVQIIYVRMLMLAGRSNAGGLLMLHDSLPYDVCTLSAVIRKTIPVITFALKTLITFQFIELVDNVIAIAAWDRLQPAGELARLAERREKDRHRKRVERAERRSQLLPSSVDASMDSLRMSRPQKIDLEIKPTTSKGEGLSSECDWVELRNLISPAEWSSRLHSVIAESVARNGQVVTQSNIRYAIDHHDPQKGSLGGLICAAIEHDFARWVRETAGVKEHDLAVARAQRISDEAKRKEQEEHDRSEFLAQQANWLKLAPNARAELARQAREKFLYLPEPAGPREAVLAAMYARGEISLSGQ